MKIRLLSNFNQTHQKFNLASSLIYYNNKHIIYTCVCMCVCAFVFTHRTNDNIVNVSRSIRIVNLLVKYARPVLFINQVHVVRFFSLVRERKYDETVLCTRSSSRREVKLSFSSKHVFVTIVRWSFILSNLFTIIVRKIRSKLGGSLRLDKLAFARRLGVRPVQSSLS